MILATLGSISHLLHISGRKKVLERPPLIQWHLFFLQGFHPLDSKKRQSSKDFTAFSWGVTFSRIVYSKNIKPNTNVTGIIFTLWHYCGGRQAFSVCRNVCHWGSTVKWVYLLPQKMQQLKGSGQVSFKICGMFFFFFRYGIAEAQKWRNSNIWPFVSKEKNQLITKL